MIKLDDILVETLGVFNVATKEECKQIALEAIRQALELAANELDDLPDTLRPFLKARITNTINKVV